MKRQENELFFKYKTKPINISGGIGFELPNEYKPIPGDIIQIIISENSYGGFVSYYGELVCYRYYDVGDPFVGIEALDGKLTTENGKVKLESTTLIQEEGKNFIYLYGPGGTTPIIEETAENTVNMIVHRSKGIIDLYFM